MISDEQTENFGSELYQAAERDELPDTTVLASLGCGNPTAVAALHEGETVLNPGWRRHRRPALGPSRRPEGKADGLDMTDEMLELARANQDKAAVTNVEWLKGHIEQIPLPDASVDVVISNCVINLSADKPKAIGMVDVEIVETHCVHPQASSAIIRARKPYGQAWIATRLARSRCACDAAFADGGSDARRRGGAAGGGLSALARRVGSGGVRPNVVG